MAKKIIYNNIEFYKIKDCPDYYVSRCGNILSTKKHQGSNIRILRQDKTRYSHVILNINNKKVTKLIHRIVASVFIPNLENKKEVNHINGIKTDNRVENLEWSTRNENVTHSFRILKQKPNSYWKGKFKENNHRSRKIKQYDLNNVFIKEWVSSTEASKNLNIPISCISRVLNKTRKSTKGFYFEFS